MDSSALAFAPAGPQAGGLSAVNRLAAVEPAVHNPPPTAAAWLAAADRSLSWSPGREERCGVRVGKPRSGPPFLAYRRRIEPTTSMQVWYITCTVGVAGPGAGDGRR